MVFATDPRELIRNRAQWRQRLATEERASIDRLLGAYQRTSGRLQGEIDLMFTELRERQGDGEAITITDIRGFRTYRSLLTRIETELQAFSAIVQDEMGATSEKTIQLGLDAGFSLAVQSAGNAGTVLAQGWIEPDVAAVRNVIGYVDSPSMRARMNIFGEESASNFADLIVTGVAQGKNPVALARMASEWFSVPFSWAENTVRTAQIYSYRTATHASYAANSQVIEGWVWQAALDARTCIACVMKHGTFYQNDQILNDHHRGRCTPLPVVRGSTWRETYETGAEWIRRQPEMQQAAQFRNGALYQAWKGGRINDSDLIDTYSDPVYGEMIRQAAANKR